MTMRVIDSPSTMALGLTILGLTPREVATVLGTTADDVREALVREGYTPAMTKLPAKHIDSLIEDALDAAAYEADQRAGVPSPFDAARKLGRKRSA